MSAFGSAKLDSDITGTVTPEPGEFVKGLRSGLGGAGSQLRSLAAGVGAAVGADQFAQEQNALARQQAEEAAAQGPRVQSYKEGFTSLRNAGDYVAGLAGQALPSVGLGVGAGAATALTGGGALAALGAGALVQAPFEVGDVLQRQQQDPTARARSPGENLRDAALTGGASAVGQALVPAALGGRLVGAGLRGAERAAATGIGRSVLRDAAIEGASEGGGEAVKQQGVQMGAPVDWNQVAENAVGGAIVGGGLGGIGGAAERFHESKGGMADAALGVAKKGTEALKRAAEPAAAPAAPPVTDFSSRIKEAAAPKVSDEDLATNGGMTPDELAEAGAPTTDRARALDILNQGASKAAEAVQRMASAYANRADIDPETRAKFADAAANAQDATKQAWAATTSAAIKAKDTFMKGVQDVTGAMEDLQKRTGEDKPATPRLEGDKKLSADESGVREAITQDVLPLVPEAVQADPKALRQVGDMVRSYIDAVKSSDFSTMETAAQKMNALFGDETEGMLARVYDKVATSDPRETERFLAASERSKTLRARDQGLRSTIERALPEDFRGDAQALTDGLVSWARGEGRVSQNAALAPAMHEQVRRQIDNVFGKNSDKVMKALEDHVLSEGEPGVQRKAPKTKDSDERMGAQQAEETGTDATTSVAHDFYGSGKNRQALKVFPSPEAHRARFPDSKESAADRLIKNLSEKYPDREVSFVPAREAAKELGWSDERLMAATGGNPDDVGFVATRRVDDPDKLGDTQIAKMRLDTSKHANSPAKVKIGDETFDAVKITKHFLKEGQGSDAKGGDARLARAFFEGVAALQERFATGDLTARTTDGREMSLGFDDSTVIGTQNGKPFTVGDAKRVDTRTDQDLQTDARKAAIKGQIAKVRDAMAGESDPDQLDMMQTRIDTLKRVAQDFHAKGVLAGDERSSDSTDILDGRQEVDQGTGNIHDLAATGGVKEVNFNSDGTPRESSTSSSLTKKGSEAVADVKALAARIGKINSPAAEKIAGRLEVLAKNVDAMSDPDRRDLLQLVNETKVSAVSETVNALARKYADVIVPPKGAAKEPARAAEPVKMSSTDVAERLAFENYEFDSPEQVMAFLEGAKKLPDNPRAKEMFDTSGASTEDLGVFMSEQSWFSKLPEAQQDQWLERVESLQTGSTPNPKAVAAKKAALDQAASSSDPALLRELRSTDDVPALGRTAAYLGESHPDSTAARVAGESFDSKMADPDTAYSMQRASPGTQGPVNRKAVNDYVQRVLGNSVAVAWDRLPHAGEFDRTSTGDVIRLSVYALNPKSVAYHESLHAFFAQLRDAGASRIGQVLEKAASQPRVKRYLENYFKNEPAVLQQIRGDAEERAAYMYQLWANDPGFKGVLNPQATSIFGKVAEFIRSVLGIWSNDQRALHIMEHFEGGEYAKNIGKPNVASLLGSGTNRAVDQLAAATEPLRELGTTLFGAGSARLRDTGNASLIRIADTIKPTVSGSENTDTGYLAASRNEFTSRLNKFGESLGQPTKPQLQEALTALQTGKPAASAEAQAIVDKVHETLQDMGKYMRDAGVKFGDLGPDYFPRVWDANTISQNQAGWLKMMDTYVQAGLYKGDPRNTMRKLIANDGNNFDVDTRMPGMQNTKERDLAFITGADAEPFLSKDLYQTMSSYISQAARRAEWSRRFGPQGENLDKMLAAATRDGASKEQIAMTERYLKGVTGTLGDSINPEARRLMGNAIVYQNIRLLPLAIFSSVVDPLGIAVRGGTMGEAWTAFKRGVREIPDNFRKYDAGRRDDSTLLAETLGTIENASLMHSLGALYSQGMTGSIGRKVNDTFFRFNLMEQYNRSMRVAATESAISFIQRHAQGVDPKNSARWLAELNLSPSDVEMGPRVVQNGQLVPRMKVTEADGLSPDKALKIRDAINKWVDGAVLRPDQADKPIWFNDPHWALISHLKQFTYSFQHTIIDRVIREAKEGNYKPAALLSSYVPVMIAADYMKGFIQGGGDQPAWKRDWGPSDYLWSGVQRAGLLGVGQMGVDVAEGIKRGESGLGTLVGPTLEQLGDAASVVGGRERFKQFTLDALPANALYSSAFKGSTPSPDPTFTE